MTIWTWKEKLNHFPEDKSHARNTHSAVFAEVKVDEEIGIQGEQELIVALNIAAEPRKWTLPGHGRLLLSTHLDRPSQLLAHGSILLRGNEGVIIVVDDYE
ncbi:MULTISPECIES: hypothetical protein [unclassified Bradyrhizobium]|uniref:hypothetical protein n=1 Tax=unclassified Bradyrhizobium TaxID=2631580 RepID=UPI0020B1D360|nr:MULTISPECIES: hypothetical protein [unclassified Bradyrhizobium]MCP3402110.1 hypothetical protein [Bradyrhizobium sp. CCGB20]MCP3410599.1 hypothetical protein [Bradyrhizobium sp. CCGB01]